MSFTITLQPGSQSFAADNNQSVLDAALANGITLPYGCRNGACGSCKGKVIAGDFDYTDNPLTGISENEKHNGYALFCQAHPHSDMVIEARLVEHMDDIPIRKLPCRVAKIDRLNHNVLRLLLKLPSTERLQFMAGQYIDILMQGGQRRSFSLANAPHDDEFLELHVRHYEGGLFSEFAFSSLEEKSLLRIEGPLGSFFLREDSNRPIIMIAGGTGFAPVKSIVEHALQKGLENPVYFYRGARSAQDLYLHELALEWDNANHNFHYIPVLSEPGPEDHWHGRTGFVHASVLEDYADLSSFDVYACGPPPMVHAVRDTFLERGLPEDRLYSDSFEFAPR
ncbi:MAG TPA: CDP-6-deoxy-delta-3,4-glucoseen reductase, partial [Gammaproteobacteria bacterium]|nr:CDP-6-deoxy-delta-3,4-glucoseen reductase [Gammaproteobacteria bacterium]